MPLYEYVCESCQHAFEELVYGDDVVACPSCRATKVHKVMSAFAVGRSDGGASAPMMRGCGSCGDPRGPGACGIG